jgi:hypothetical protein
VPGRHRLGARRLVIVLREVGSGSEPDPEIVAALEKLLELARKGDVLGLGVVSVHRGDDSMSFFKLVRGCNVGADLYLELSVLLHRMRDRCAKGGDGER